MEKFNSFNLDENTPKFLIPRQSSSFGSNNITFLDLLNSFNNVLVRHNENPLDIKWIKVKDFIQLAWLESTNMTSITTKQMSQPIASKPSNQTVIDEHSIISYQKKSNDERTNNKMNEKINNKTNEKTNNEMNDQANNKMEEKTNEKINKKRKLTEKMKINRIYQGRIYSVNLHDIPLINGSIKITIRNFGGILDQSDVTKYFISDDSQQEIDKRKIIKWVLKPLYATNKLASAIPTSKQGLDKLATHYIYFTITDYDTKQIITRVYKIPIIVIGRGSKQKSKYQFNVIWDDLILENEIMPKFKRQSEKGNDNTDAEQVPSKRSKKNHDDINEENEEEKIVIKNLESLRGLDMSIQDSRQIPTTQPTIQPIIQTTTQTTKQSVPDLQLQIRLIKLPNGIPIENDSIIPNNTLLGIAIKNPLDVSIRVVCLIHDKNDRHLNNVIGESKADIKPQNAIVIRKFEVLSIDKPIIHLFVAKLPLSNEIQPFYKKLIINVE